MINESIYKIVRMTRSYMSRHVTDLDEEQLLEIPDGAGANVLWNVGHVLFTHASMLYPPCGLPMPIPEEYEALFKAGTSPSDWSETPNVEEVLGRLKDLTEHTYVDYKTGKFDQYEDRELLKGYSLDSVEDAFAVNILHEGVHIGVIMSLRKQLGAVKA